MKYPASWKMIDNPAAGAIVAFSSPAQTALDTYSENVNISFQNLSSTSTNLSQFSQLAIRQLTGTFKQAVQVVESDPTQLAGRPAYRFSYLIVDPKSSLKFLHVWVLAGARAYIFTYSATEKDFDVFSKEVNTMLKSFTVLH